MPSMRTRSIEVTSSSDSRHQIARGAIIEPAQRQQLNVRIQIAAQIENYFLFESIVQQKPQ